MQAKLNNELLFDWLVRDKSNQSHHFERFCIEETVLKSGCTKLHNMFQNLEISKDFAMFMNIGKKPTVHMNDDLPYLMQLRKIEQYF